MAAGCSVATNSVADATNVYWASKDGYITLSEANWHYRTGNGTPLYADLGKLNLSRISVSDFPGGVGSSASFNLDSPRYMGSANDGLVYGTIRLTLGKNRSVTSNFDIYDFDMQRGRFLRNVATRIGNFVAGGGTPYSINFYGTGTIGD